LFAAGAACLVAAVSVLMIRLQTRAATVPKPKPA